MKQEACLTQSSPLLVTVSDLDGSSGRLWTIYRGATGSNLWYKETRGWQ